MEKRKELLLTQGIKIAKLEGLRREREMLRELVDTTIEARDKEGFDFLKEIHNNKVKEISDLKEEIDKNMEEVDNLMEEAMKEMARELVEGLDIEQVLKAIMVRR